MTTLKFIGIYALAFVCTFSWIWRTVVETTTSRHGPLPLWPAWQFNARYVALVLQRMLYCFIGMAAAVVIILLYLFVLVPRL
jgi:hypothetical protein